MIYIAHISEYLHFGIHIPIPKYSMFAKPLCCVNHEAVYSKNLDWSG